MKRTHITILAGALTLAASAAIGLAQPPAPPAHPMDSAAPPPPGLDRGAGPGFGRAAGPGILGPRELADYLGLTDEQRSSARELLRQQHESMRPLVESQRDLRQQLDVLLDDPHADAAALGKLVQEIHANRQQLEAAREQVASQLETILTADQKAKLEQLRSAMETFRGMRKSRHVTRAGNR